MTQVVVRVSLEVVTTNLAEAGLDALDPEEAGAVGGDGAGFGVDALQGDGAELAGEHLADHDVAVELELEGELAGAEGQDPLGGLAGAAYGGAGLEGRSRGAAPSAPGRPCAR